MIDTSVRHANEQWLRLALEAAQLTAWEWDLTAGTVTYSSSETTYFRLPPGQITRTIDMINASVYPPDFPIYQQAVAGAIAHGAAYQVQVRVRAANGQMRWLDVRGIVQHDAAGQPHKIIGVTRDISIEKRREINQAFHLAISQTLRPELDVAATLEALARLPLPDLADCCSIFLRDDDGYVSPAIAVRQDSAHAVQLNELPSPESLGITPAIMQEVLHTGMSRIFADLPPDHAHGTGEAPLHSALLVRLAAQGRVLGMMQLGITTDVRRYDIDDLALAEALAGRGAEALVRARLRASVQEAERNAAAAHARLDALITSAPSGIGYLDRDLRYMLVNPALAAINGRTPADHIGKTLPEMLPGLAPRLYPLVRRVLETGEAVRDIEMHGKPCPRDGIAHDWLVSYFPVVGSDRSIDGVGVTVIDITASKRTEIALRESQQNLSSLIENTDGSIWSVTAAYRLIVGNTLFQRDISAAIGREVAPGECLMELPLSQEVLDTWRVLYDRALAGETFSVEQQTGSVADLHTIEYRLAPIRTAAGDITGATIFGRDITARLHAEAQLRETERKLATLFEILPVGVSILDAEHTLAYANPALAQILKLDRTELFAGSHHTRRYLRPDGSPMLAEDFASTRALRKQQTVSNIEVGIATETGDMIWVNVSAAPVNFPDWRVVIVTVDITARKQTEELLRVSRAKLAAALESMTDAVFISDTEGRFIDFNEAFATFHKFCNKNECAKTLAEYPAFLDVFMSTGEAAPLEQWAVSRALRGETATNAEYTLRRRDTGVTWVGSYSFAPIRAPDGTITGSVVVGRDITERKHAEAALRASEERLRLAQQVAHIGVFDTDLLTGVTIWTRELEALYGLQPGEFRGSQADWEQLVHPEDQTKTQCLVQQAFETKLPIDGVWRVLWPDGSVHWIVGRFQVFTDESGTPRRFTGVNMDITARKRDEERQRQIEAKVQQMQKLESMGVLSGGIAHDFNNMLTSILGYADLALLELPTNSPARYLLSQAINGARQAADLTNQLLAYSGKGRFVVEPLNLSQLIEEITRLLEISISKKCVLKYNLMPNLPSIAADATQVRQVIMNLVINASEAIGDRSGFIALTTSVMHCDRAYLSETYLDEDLPEGLYVYLEVADNGIGMSAETRVRVFDPFFTTKFTGRGLGLAAVLGIVRGHRGAIKIYSELGIGSTFKALFPATDLPASASEQNTDGTTEWRGSGTVLVIDDEESVRGLARRMIERMGFTVLTAADGREGVDLLRSNAAQITLVLLDMTMPHMDGEETFRELRRIRSDMLAILSSGYNEQTATSRFVGKGLAAFIQKPYRFEDLRAVVRKVIEKGQAGDS